MRASYCGLMLGALAASACGADDTAPIAIELRMASQALLTDVATVRVHLHPGRVECDVLTLTGSDYVAPYRVNIDIGTDATSGQGTIFDVVEGEYTADAWGFAESRAVRAHGCADRPVRVERGRLAQVSISLSAHTDL